MLLAMGLLAGWLGLGLALGEVEAGASESGANRAASQASAAPGSIVRWSTAGVDRCGLGDRTWAPLQGVCLYPVDLKRTGSITLRRRVEGVWENRRLGIGDYPYPVQHITLKDDSTVHLSPENIARSRRESARVGALWRNPSEARFTLPLAAPLDPLPEGRRFGSRRVFNGEPRNPHTGVDYTADRGTPVGSTAAGTVVLAEEHFFAGKSVFVDHGDELVSMYFHLDTLAVETGQEVRRGETLGTVGSTGRSTGAHLHFGLRWHGARVDPALLLGPVREIADIP
ncbi:MAG: M23 family metallopeptidase [Acidobacteriota bacterium]|nr:M23 family metallopeptidase [Acidobacteriota bacterium]